MTGDSFSQCFKVFHSWQRQGDVGYDRTLNDALVRIGPNFSQCLHKLTTTQNETEIFGYKLTKYQTQSQVRSDITRECPDLRTPKKYITK